MQPKQPTLDKRCSRNMGASSGSIEKCGRMQTERAYGPLSAQHVCESPYARSDFGLDFVRNIVGRRAITQNISGRGVVVPLGAETRILYRPYVRCSSNVVGSVRTRGLTNLCRSWRNAGCHLVFCGSVGQVLRNAL
jgi:hypothetical protein